MPTESSNEQFKIVTFLKSFSEASKTIEVVCQMVGDINTTINVQRQLNNTTRQELEASRSMLRRVPTLDRNSIFVRTELANIKKDIEKLEADLQSSEQELNIFSKLNAPEFEASLQLFKIVLEAINNTIKWNRNTALALYNTNRAMSCDTLTKILYSICSANFIVIDDPLDHKAMLKSIDNIQAFDAGKEEETAIKKIEELSGQNSETRNCALGKLQEFHQSVSSNYINSLIAFLSTFIEQASAEKYNLENFSTWKDLINIKKLDQFFQYIHSSKQMETPAETCEVSNDPGCKMM